MKYDTAKLRQFIQEYFSSEELRTLLFDYFRPVHDNLTDGMTKNRYVLLLLEHCHNHGKMPDLLAAIQRERDFFQPDDYVQGQKAPATAPPTPAPITRNPRQIFISHAHQDAEVAQKLAHDLAAHGYNIWIAPDSIRPGEKWVEAINRGLEESGIFLLLMSPEAIVSRWVNTETNIAIELNHQGEMGFFSLMLKECRPPVLWGSYHYISLRGGYGSGLAALLNALEPQAAQPFIVVESEPPVRVPPPVMNKNSFVHTKTGKEFVRVPAGEFLYGEKKENLHLDAFWMAKTAVTNAEYKRFLDANPNYAVPFRDGDWVKPYNWDRQRRTYPKEKANHPVVLVSWHDAQAYARWAGLALPTEQQWEKAARGTDGRQYPWGDDWRENHTNTSESGIRQTTPVGQFSPQGDSPYGCVDMAGNVWEWTNSWRDEKQKTCVLCGVSWGSDRGGARVAFHGRNLPDYSVDDIGFRVVSPVVSGS